MRKSRKRLDTFPNPAKEYLYVNELGELSIWKWAMGMNHPPRWIVETQNKRMWALDIPIGFIRYEELIDSWDEE